MKFEFCKMDIRPTLERKNRLLDPSFRNRTRLAKHPLGPFFKEIVKQVSVKNIGRMGILQNSRTKARVIGVLLALCIVPPLLAYAPARGPEYASGEKVRFAPVHIYLDSGNAPLAAYQFELKAKTGQIKIVGVEGGEHPAFQEAPYYDPAALMNDRIIIAAFNTGSDLPHGRTRIATIHLQILGDADPQYELKLVVAADNDAEKIPADLSLQTGENQ